MTKNLLKKIVIPSKSAQNPRIRDIMKASNDWIWMASNSMGVLAMNHSGEIVKSYSIKEGMITNHIYQLQEDIYGGICAVTEYGISYINPKDDRVINFNKQHGINFPHNMRPGKFMDSKGNIYFSEGIITVYFHPDDLVGQTKIPPVYITDFRINENILNGIFKDTIIYLKHNENNLSFKFCAINHRHSYMNKYSYTGKGQEAEWYFTDFQNLSVRYNNLKGGEYVFHVKASNHIGLWNDEGIQLRLVIAIPFWERTWFILLVLGIAILIAFSIGNERNKSKRKREIEHVKREIVAQVHERERISKDLHDDIGAQLSILKMYIQAINENASDKVKLQEYSRESSEMIGKTISSMRGIINELSPQTLGVYGYATAVKEFVYYLSNTTEIQFHLSLEDFESKLEKTAETALFRITQELINNSEDSTHKCNFWLTI
jgi:signal transduction histidine kinase